MQETLRAFNGLHPGADILVCGCGPSLLELEDPARHLAIGVNDVGRLFDPTYLVVLNPRAQFKGDRFRYVAESNARALFTQLDLGPVKPPVVRFRLGRYGGTDAADDGVLDFTQNSPYVAVGLAARMGAARIGLVGVDFTDGHFFAETGRHALSGRLKEIDAQYGRLAAALSARGIALVNLGAASRLRSLPRMRIDADGGWRPIAAHAPVTAHAIARMPGTPCAAPSPPPARSGGATMKIAVEKRVAGAVGDLLQALAESAAALGHRVVRDPRATAHDPSVLSVVWNGRGYTTRGPRVYCEHGWLPRSDYQVSHRGINADSHAAPFAWNGTVLSSAQDAALDAHVAAIKSASHAGHYRYMQAGGLEDIALPDAFLLVPLQIETDTNIVRHVPPALRTMQAFVDHLSACDPPWPLIFKQHPADARSANRHLRLRLRRRQDQLWPQARGNVHQMLSGGRCRGIVTLNSNVAHDGLLWDVPAVVLGRNVWPQRGAVTPFLTALPDDWSLLEASARGGQGRACRRAYAHHLIEHQWTLAQASDPRRVAELIEVATRHRASPTPSRVARIVPPPRAIAAASRPMRPPAPPPMRAPALLHRRAHALPTINIVAENKGWLFELWKHALAACPLPGFRLAGSQKPMPQADAWVFLRASEAARSPDPMRSVVQLHDLCAPALYRSGGAREAVARCAGIALTHPDQADILRDAGITLSMRRWSMQPVGWRDASTAAALDADIDDAPLLAWVGRRALLDGRDVSGLDDVVAAVRALRRPLRLRLIGERLEPVAAELRRDGIECRALGPAQCPLARCADWIARFDAVLVTTRADSGPWPLFDAVRAGVPVVATPVGWAGRLLGDGECGVLVDDAAALPAGIADVLDRRAHWRARREASDARLPASRFDAWAQASLRLAAELAGASRRAVA
jgi:hypothetical protein